jgi:hypothetical protein
MMFISQGLENLSLYSSGGHLDKTLSVNLMSYDSFRFTNGFDGMAVDGAA